MIAKLSAKMVKIIIIAKKLSCGVKILMNVKLVLKLKLCIGVLRILIRCMAELGLLSVLVSSGRSPGKPSVAA